MPRTDVPRWQKTQLGGPGILWGLHKKAGRRLVVGTGSVCPVTVARGREGSRAYFVGTHAHSVLVHTYTLTAQGHRDVSFFCLPLLLCTGQGVSRGMGMGMGEKIGMDG